MPERTLVTCPFHRDIDPSCWIESNGDYLCIRCQRSGKAADLPKEQSDVALIQPIVVRSPGYGYEIVLERLRKFAVARIRGLKGRKRVEAALHEIQCLLLTEWGAGSPEKETILREYCRLAHLPNWAVPGKRVRFVGKGLVMLSAKHGDRGTIKEIHGTGMITVLIDGKSPLSGDARYFKPLRKKIQPGSTLA